MTKSRRKFQFSLRLMLVLITAFAVWLGWQNSRSTIQRRAVEELKGAGASVVYDFQIDASGNSVPDASISAPRWLVNVLGEDFFARVIGINAHNNKPSATTTMDDALVALDSLPSVKYVHLGGSGVTDGGLQHISKLTSLERLGLEYTKVTNEGIAKLRNSRSLRRLYLNGLRIDDDGVSQLEGLSNLEVVEVEGTKVTEVGLSALQMKSP